MPVAGVIMDTGGVVGQLVYVCQGGKAFDGGYCFYGECLKV